MNTSTAKIAAEVAASAPAAKPVAQATNDYSGYPQVPTLTGDPTKVEWNISNSVLGCGLLNFQGWSSGIGINGNEKLEDKLFLLTYYSAHQQKYPHTKWGAKALPGGSVEAPIGVSRMRYQFLSDRFGLVCGSYVEWLERLGKFIKEHDLGDFSITHSYKNKQWGNHVDAVGLWNWNGKHPNPEKFPNVKVVL